MKKTILLLAAFLVLSTSLIGQNKQNTQTVHVILLAGQSNMAGAGNFNELSKKTKKRIQKAGKRIKVSYSGKSATPLSYFIKADPKNKYGFNEAFGPELFLGLELAKKNPKQEYLFIKRAHGGTALHGAWNPDWSAEKAQAVEKKGPKQALKLYDSHLNDIKKNLETLEEAGKTYEIIGLLWMQGENDAAKEVAALNYEENLKNLISHYRQAFNLPEMPFVMGQINSSYGRFKDGPAVVRQAMVDVAEADNKVEVIRTSMDRSWSDFPKHTDNVHYNTEGQLRLGKTFANRLMKLQ